MDPTGRRDAILVAAARLFRHYGHAKTTIQDVAREAKVAVGSVYLEFDSKEAIVEELSNVAHARVLEAMRRAARDKARAPFSARLASVMEVRVARLCELRAEGQHACELLFCKASGVKSAHARFKDEETTLLRGLLEEARDEGVLGPHDPRSAALLVQRAYVSLSPPYLFDMDEAEARSVARAMAALLVDGLTARDRRRGAKS